jgi:hypothetical protein
MSGDPVSKLKGMAVKSLVIIFGAPFVLGFMSQSRLIEPVAYMLAIIVLIRLAAAAMRKLRR